jgi:hypothetical protein
MNEHIGKYHVQMSAAPVGQRVYSLAERYASRTSKKARNG